MRNEDIGIECCIDVKLGIIGQIICYVDCNWSIIFLFSSISAEIEQMQVNLKDYYLYSRYAFIGSKSSLVIYIKGHVRYTLGKVSAARNNLIIKAYFNQQVCLIFITVQCPMMVDWLVVLQAVHCNYNIDLLPNY